MCAIREHDYSQAAAYPELYSLGTNQVREISLRPENLDLGNILDRYLSAYEVALKVVADRQPTFKEELQSRSEGLPFYVRHLVLRLRDAGADLTEEALAECPQGLTNLIWDTLPTRYRVTVIALFVSPHAHVYGDQTVVRAAAQCRGG